MDIHIKIIPESEQRECVNGCDWFWDSDGNLQVRVSPLSDWRIEVMLGVHEAVEAVMCKHSGVTQESVDAFDVEFDKTHPTDLGAGDDPSAPYHRQHIVATDIETILGRELEVDWIQYMKELETAYPGPSKKT